MQREGEGKKIALSPHSRKKKKSAIGLLHLPIERGGGNGGMHVPSSSFLFLLSRNTTKEDPDD